MIQRLYYLIIKEFTQLRNSPDLLRMIILLPIAQMLIFGYAAVLDVKNIDTAVLDRDNSYRSRELLNYFARSDYFILKEYVTGEAEISDLLDHEKIFAAIVIPPDFSRKINASQTTEVQVIVDGTNASAAGIISTYAAGTIGSFANSVLRERGLDPSRFGAIAVETRFLYNPALDNRFFFLPGMFAMIILIIGMPMTARAIVREKEQGTLEQIIVTPITSMELILGKVIPYTLLSVISSSGIILVSHFWFHLPVRGSLPFLYGATVLFLLNCFGIGIFISAISSTQQQAMLTSFFVNMPMILFSGFLFPVENMPLLFRYFTYLNPMYYFINCVRDICLKGSGFDFLSRDIAAMGILGVCIFGLSIASFKKRID
jgi:ABC-2 type transport system permease protein